MDDLRAYAPRRIMRPRAVTNGELRRLVVEQAERVAARGAWSAVPGNVGRALCEYVADAVPYVEDGAVQSIRLPSALVLGGMSGDCKSTAVFVGGLAAAAGRAVVLRFVQYPTGPAWLSHVYAVVDGVACDPLQGYGVEAPFARSEDVAILRP